MARRWAAPATAARRRIRGGVLRRGLSLVEMAVVIMVIALVMLIFTPLLGQWISSFSEESEAALMARHLEFSRNTAIKSNRVVVFRIDLDEDRYEAYSFDRSGSQTEKKQLIEATEVHIRELRTAYSNRIDQGAIRLHFLPSGVGEELQISFEVDTVDPLILCFNRYSGAARVGAEECPDERAAATLSPVREE